MDFIGSNLIIIADNILILLTKLTQFKRKPSKHKNKAVIGYKEIIRDKLKAHLWWTSFDKASCM